MVAGVNQQSVLADADLLYVRHAAQWGQHGDFVPQVRQFGGRDRAESRVAERGHLRHVAHRLVQGLERRYVSDAAAKLSVLGQGDERPALLRQRLQAAGGTLVGLSRAHRGLHRRTRDLEQRVLLPRAQGKRRLGAPGGAGSLHQGHGAISHHAAVVPGDVAGVGVVEELGLRRAQPLGGNHGGHDGSSAACLPDAQIQVARQVEVIVLFHGFQRFVVEFLRLIVGVIVREV